MREKCVCKCEDEAKAALSFLEIPTNFCCNVTASGVTYFETTLVVDVMFTEYRRNDVLLRVCGVVGAGALNSD